MTRDDLLGFIELAPVGDTAPVWNVLAKVLADELLKDLDDIDAKTVLEVLCRAPKPKGDDELKLLVEEAEETKEAAGDDETPSGGDGAEDKAESTTKPPEEEEKPKKEPYRFD